MPAATPAAPPAAVSVATLPPTRRLTVPGPAGALEVLFDLPVGAPTGIAVVAHPHPSQGGTAEHKIPQVLARALQAYGFATARPNYRGVGASEGRYDGGPGEAEDVRAVLGHLRAQYPGVPLALAGFSFGAYVMTLAAGPLQAAGETIAHLILSGMPAGTLSATLAYDTPAIGAIVPEPLIVHGERDERVPLANVFAWARPQELPVVVIPGAGHFFTGKLPALRTVVEGFLRRPAASAAGAQLQN
ncbi:MULTISPECIES: alpha/beta hydrolase [unclassified Cupriavidus]|uniref:alpha/beta hydrolase n=1 Tax=Cupriavidus sp. H19C3 TaxID=3241603 RepID=UPI003BF7847A